MIEITSIVPCESSEEHNIRELNRLKQITYLSSEAIFEKQLDNKYLNGSYNGSYNSSYTPSYTPSYTTSSYDSKFNKYTEICNSIISNNTNSSTPYSGNNRSSKPQLTKGVKYEKMKPNMLHCRYGMGCRDFQSGKCNFIHSTSKPQSNKICRRGPTCEFLLEGKCAFIH